MVIYVLKGSDFLLSSILPAELQDVEDACGAGARELVADVRGIPWRSGAYAACFIPRREIMGALERNALGRIGGAQKEYSRPNRRGVLAVLIGPFENNALGARIIRNVRIFFKNLTSFKLPPSSRIVHIRKRQLLELVNHRTSWLPYIRADRLFREFGAHYSSDSGAL